MKIVKVEWKDAHTRHTTLGIDEIKEENLIKAITIGYLVDENKERIAICGFIFPDDKIEDYNMDDKTRETETLTGFRNVTFIPKKLIKKITILEK